MRVYTAHKPGPTNHHRPVWKSDLSQVSRHLIRFTESSVVTFTLFLFFKGQSKLGFFRVFQQHPWEIVRPTEVCLSPDWGTRQSVLEYTRGQITKQWSGWSKTSTKRSRRQGWNETIGHWEEAGSSIPVRMGKRCRSSNEHFICILIN